MDRCFLRLLLAAALLLGLWLPVSAAQPQTAAESDAYAILDEEETEREINDEEHWWGIPEELPEDSGSSAALAEATPEFTITAAGSVAGTDIHSFLIQDEYWLILPASADPSAVTLSFAGMSRVTLAGSQASVTIRSGGSIDLNALCGGASEAGDYCLAVTAKGNSYTLKLHFSENVSAMYLSSDDPVNQGRSWVEASAEKTNQATGSMVLQNPDGTLVYNDTLTQIKGRGNTTWRGAKRPYQIKLGTKTDLLETGNKDNKNKTWVLLANYYDPTLLHNALSDDLAKALGMEYNMEYRFVDLYYDGEYRGSYMLCEKVAINSGRVAIHDLEGDNEKANPEITDFSALSSAQGTTANGAGYCYWEGISSPSDITGGYLLEMDYSNRAIEEASYFWTSRGMYVTVKSPEYCSKEEMDYIASLYQEYEDALYNHGTNPATGKKLSQYMDVESMAKCYLINELSKNPDSFITSAYIYKDIDSDIMTMGPVWDYDLAYGLGHGYYNEQCKDSTGWFAARISIGNALCSCGEFCTAVYETWTQELEPLVRKVLLGDADAVSADGSLHSLAWYAAQNEATAACNYVLWDIITVNHENCGGDTYSENIDYLSSWLRTRYNWINQHAEEKFYTILCSLDGHDWVLDEAASVAPSCTEEGKTVRWCDRCGEIESTTVPAAGHSPEAGSVETVQEPTACHDGCCTFTCSVCHAAGVQQTIPRVFLDTQPTAYYASAVDSFYARRIVYGVSKTAFGPDESITRGMLVTLLYRMAGRPAYSGTASFADVNPGDYYAAAVNWAYENHIVYGFSRDRFGPNVAISRQDLVVILYRYARSLGVDVTSSGSLSRYQDAAAVDVYAQKAMVWAVENGIIRGTSSTELSPRATATRSQGVTMLYRFERYLENTK